MINPTNPMEPANETLATTSSDDEKNKSCLTRTIGIPRCNASSSPELIASRSRAKYIETLNPMNTRIAEIPINKFEPAPESDPNKKNKIENDSRLNNVKSNRTRAPKKVLEITPAKIKV